MGRAITRQGELAITPARSAACRLLRRVSQIPPRGGHRVPSGHRQGGPSATELLAFHRRRLGTALRSSEGRFRPPRETRAACSRVEERKPPREEPSVSALPEKPSRREPVLVGAVLLPPIPSTKPPAVPRPEAEASAAPGTRSKLSGAETRPPYSRPEPPTLPSQAARGFQQNRGRQRQWRRQHARGVRPGGSRLTVAAPAPPATPVPRSDP